MRFRNTAITLIAVLFAGSALAAPGLITIKVNGTERRVTHGSTVDEVLTAFHLHPAPGGLLDVDGIMLRAAATPGEVLVDDRKADLSETVNAGDQLRVIDGKDTTEKLRKVVRKVSARDTSNPQTRLETAAGTETILQGSVSRKIVSVTFKPTGPRKPLSNTVALTIDDGPSLATPKFLEILQENKVKATFFDVGIQAKLYPQYVKAETKAGMVVANHSWDHPVSPPFARLNGARMRSEFEQAQSAIAKNAPKPKLFRPPGGSISSEVVNMAKHYGMRSVLWSVDPKDWRKGTSPSTIASRVLSQVQAGSIILLHDGGNNAWNTAAALQSIIDGIKRKGLKIVPVEP